MLPKVATQKIRGDHLDRPALIYVRQSTPFQVRENTASTARQYDLAHRASDLGWSEHAIQVIDQDQGLSGASPPIATASTSSSPRSGWARPGPSSAWKPRAWHAPAAIGIACWKSAP